MAGTPYMRARCKTGVVAGRTGAVAHFPAGFRASFQPDGSVRFRAEFLCGNQSVDAIVLARAEDAPAMCAVCEDAAKGPRVYRCLNSDKRVIYIGSTPALLRRIKVHKSRSPWWPEVADVTEEPYPSVFLARAAERLAIKAERPIHNDQYNRRSA
jgi:predicted GIY-YIG superfamily endonuclease